MTDEALMRTAMKIFIVSLLTLFISQSSFASHIDADKSPPLLIKPTAICEHFKNILDNVIRDDEGGIVSSGNFIKTPNGELRKTNLKIENTSENFSVYSLRSCSHYFCGSYIVYFPIVSAQKSRFEKCIKKQKCPIKATSSNLTSPDFLVDNIQTIWSDAKVISGVNGERSTPRYTYAHLISYNQKYYVYLIDSSPHQSEGPTLLLPRKNKKLDTLCQFKEPTN